MDHGERQQAAEAEAQWKVGAVDVEEERGNGERRTKKMIILNREHRRQAQPKKRS